MKGRYEIFIEGKGLAFGRDHACGEFLQIWDTTKHREPDGENILVDEDTLTGLTKDRMEKLVQEHGFTMDQLAAEYNRQA